MAIELDYLYRSGVTGNFWDVTKYCINRVDKSIEVSIGLWLDKQAWLDGKDPIQVFDFGIDGVADKLDPQNIAAIESFVYGEIKLLPQFTGAKDA